MAHWQQNLFAYLPLCWTSYRESIVYVPAFKREECWVRLCASQFFWTEKWGGQFLCCPPALKSGGTRPPRPPPIDARGCSAAMLQTYYV